MWNDNVILGYKCEPHCTFDLPLKVSSKIGDEEERLEAMLRSDERIKWPDILGRVLHRVVRECYTSSKAGIRCLEDGYLADDEGARSRDDEYLADDEGAMGN